ncbi:MAG: MerR family transcriptional regulator [Boseongicola sp.]
MEKSPDAFRTISEVADWLDIPTHVLRFWESRFSQIKPVKRAGGRRYYRPSDMRLIGGVKTLLHDQGMTIRGVQKVLREQGVKHVSSFSKILDSEITDPEVIEHEPIQVDAAAPAPAARGTHDAEPVVEPDADDTSHDEVAVDESVDEAEGDQKDESQPDMFPDEPSEAAEVVASGDEESILEPSEVDSAAGAVIPDTPDVPSEDIADDAAGYAGVPGIAARLASVPSAELAKHRATLADAKERLVSLRGRLL